MLTIAAAAPGSPAADSIVRAYMTDVASGWHGRPATEDEVGQALRDEPYDDLRGTTGLLVVAFAGADPEPVACAGVRFLDPAAELTKVFTLPAWRGRGIGAALLDAVEHACRMRGVRTLRLDTRAELAEACALYERRGFRRVEPFNDEPYSDRWYRKLLA